jgi:tetratricopeptide (TPR) repeat protein
MRHPAGRLCALLVIALAAGCDRGGGGAPAPVADAGSKTCRECHERFYQLWSTSHHGLAMQVFTPALAAKDFRGQAEPIAVRGSTFRAEPAAGRVVESGPAGEKHWPIAHVLGGRNVYFLLAPFERGRLQTLPVAYDVRRKEWYHTSASAMRHFTDAAEQEVHWTEPEWTFNTSCHGCHVSQFAPNYDRATDSYRTTWAEPGINCDTCHGDTREHVRVCRAAPAGAPPKDLRIISTKRFTHEQLNDACAPCHAKMSPVTSSFTPGERYADHFDLVAYESRDFHPDGRDLGENYTMTSWRASPCATRGALDCMHCHTSSGRYRFREPGTENNACLPCHAERVRDAAAHHRHPAGKAGTRCVECHMPTTAFARMTRSDHSMRPPTPAATIAFHSPNACTLCHADHDAAWADAQVRAWHAKDYQAPALARGRLVEAARQGDWSALPAMLGAVSGPGREEVLAVSLIRLLRGCALDAKWPGILAAARDPSPWVRAAAMEALGDRLVPESLAALAAGCRDGARLVRVRAAYALAPVPPEPLAAADRAAVAAATRELEASLAARPDDYASHYNLGNIFMSRRDPARAIAAFEEAIRLRPDVIPPYVNIALAYNLTGRNRDAEARLREALRRQPGNAAASLNLAMLLAEMGRVPEAETMFRAAIQADPTSAAAAYNLAVIAARDRLDEALAWARKAAALEPREAKYAYTLAFTLREKGELGEAAAVLERLLEGPSAIADAYALLGALYERQGRDADARALYRRGAEDARLPDADRARLRAMR